jgi:penicillin-binding protein 1C
VKKGLIALCLIMALQVIIILADLILTPDLQRARLASAVVLDRQGHWVRAIPVKGGIWRLRADLNRLDLDFQKRLLALEDKRFRTHLGLDPLAMTRAIGSNIRAGKIVSGASTITMQTARLLSPKPRTLASKLSETIRALQLEYRYSKSEILELYLTLTPYGGNLEGVRAASLAWFGHEPDSLTLDEQALLAALPQSPEQRRPDRRMLTAKNARDKVLRTWQKAKLITPDQAYEASQASLPSSRLAFPVYAPHLAERLVKSASENDRSILTSLDLSLQIVAEKMVRQTAISQGVNANAAAIIVHIPTREIRAHVASAGFDRPGGYIDMSRALRSPGSTLKPFVYALGFDDALIEPHSRMMDVPSRFGDYVPDNFDKRFHGEVSVRDALIHSLNIPAVFILSKIGPERFSSRLKSVGVELIRPQKALKGANLSLALGGEGMKLEDLVSLYAALGDKGRYKALRYRIEPLYRIKADRSPYHYLVSEDSSVKVLEILESTPSPKGFVPAGLRRQGVSIAYKTGTSYGFRDALAVGVSGDYAVAVWTGRTDGGARGNETGRDASAPLMFSLFDALHAPTPRPSIEAPPKPKNQIAKGLQTNQIQSLGLQILFPQAGSTIFVITNPTRPISDQSLSIKRPLIFSARGAGEVRFTVNNIPLSPNADGQIAFYPPHEGFYKIRATDDAGETKEITVRIKAIYEPTL